MKGSHTLLFIGLASAALLFYAYKRGPGVKGGVQTPGRAATGGTTSATKPVTKPPTGDPLKALEATAKAEGTAYGQKVIHDWFAGLNGAP